MAAPACLILRRPQLVWLFTLLASALAFIISILLLQQVMQTGTISYELGGWSPPWGIEYRIDKLNAFIALIISGVSTVVLLAAQTSIEKEIPQDKHTLFYILYLLSLTGMLGIVTTGDAFNVFVFLEISSLSAYSLIALGRDRRALWASFQYLIMGTIGATFILIGIGLMYQMTGTLNMADLAARLPEVAETRTVTTAYVFFIVGVCLKLALFPLHLWLPNAYAHAPSIVTAFFAATYQGGRIFADSLYLFNFWGVVFLYHPANGDIVLRIGFIGYIRGLYRGHLSRQHKTCVCLFQCGSDWLHDCWFQHVHQRWLKRHAVACVQSCTYEGSVISGFRRCALPRWQHPA